MAIDRVKLLTRFTIPAGGWDFRLIGEFGQPGQANVDVTIPAGDYYMAGDYTSDDFMSVFATTVNAEIHAVFAYGRSHGIRLWIDSDHKVTIKFLCPGAGQYDNGADGRNNSIEWTFGDGASIGAVLGFDTSADLELTGTDYPEATGTWHHAYGWYSDVDGELEFMDIENLDDPMTLQSFGPGGHSRAQYIGSKRTRSLRLGFVPRTKIFSQDKDYTDTPVYPYEKNEPLECWWKAARQGTEFRVYRQNVLDTSMAQETGSWTGTATGPFRVTDATKSWDTDPQRWAGAIAQFAQGDGVSDASNFLYMHVASHTATELTMTGGPEPIALVGPSGTSFWLYDIRYDTYVVDLRGMRGFSPEEIPQIDKFNISIPLVKYQA